MTQRVPFEEPMVDNRGYTTTMWGLYFSESARISALNSGLVAVVSATQQTDSIATSNLTTLANQGLYSLSYMVRVTTPGSVTSSIQVTVQWTQGGVVQTYPGAAVTTNLTTSYQSATVPLILCDAATAVTYSTTYAANAANSMAYELYLALQSVSL